jgi:hypothetical protein
MRTTRLGLWLTVGATLVACSKGAGSAAPDGGGASTSGSSSGGKNDAGSSTTKPGGDGGTSTAPLTPAVTLRNIGRNGQTLQLAVQGNDPAGNTTEAHVQLLDASGNPVTAFDTNWDGIADSSEQLLHFDQSTLGQKNFAQTITLAGLFAASPTIGSAVVAFSDIAGNLAPALTTTLHVQTVAALGAKCDVGEVTDRCAAGLSCSGTLSTCQATVAPTLTQVAYYGGTSPAQFFVGTDPDEDLMNITISFLDASGKSLAVDLVGDGDLVSQATLDARAAAGTSFTYANNPVSNFALSVPKISAVAVDAMGHSGVPVVASRTTQPTHSNGGICDPYGVIGCETGSACSPGVVTAANTCGAIATLQKTKCTAAETPATSGTLAAWALVQGVSLWDPPVGCAFATEYNRPESLVTLKLTQNVSQLTISTAVPETDFDTVLYVLPNCATSSAQALGCNDDAQGFASTLKLTNVAAGTYTIVVDSATAQGGHFGLVVSSL